MDAGIPDLQVLKICARAAHCPACAKPNRCRMETGECYKGPCWCEAPIVSATAMRRLMAEMPEPRCLCHECLELVANDSPAGWQMLIARNQQANTPQPLQEGDTYREGGAIVFTEQYLPRRGYCCESGCRHCPYTGAQSVESTL